MATAKNAAKPAQNKVTLSIAGGEEHDVTEHFTKEPAKKAGAALKNAPSDEQDAAKAKLRSYIERIERLEEDKAGLGADVRDVFSEAKSNGFDVKTMRTVLKLRKMKVNDRTEQEYMLDLYKQVLGMQTEMDFGERH